MIYIVRHGQTELNQRSVLQGRSNHPLNEVGREHRHRLRQSLYESPGPCHRDSKARCGRCTDRVRRRPHRDGLRPLRRHGPPQPAAGGGGVLPRLHEPPRAGGHGTAVFRRRAGRRVPRTSESGSGPSRHPALHPRNCYERGIGVPDTCVTGQLLVKTHRKLYGICSCRIQWQIWGSL